MCRMDDARGLQIHVTWSDSCGNCGCVANWHAVDIPEGVTMVALPERFPCKGFEFAGCGHNCEDFVFQPATATIGEGNG